MSILGFSIVGNSEMIFILVFPNPRKGVLKPREGGGLGCVEGVRLSSIPSGIMCYVNSVVFKNYLHFHFRVPPTPARAPSGGVVEGLLGGKDY